MALKKYELVLVLSLSKGEEAVEALKAKFIDMIGKHGTLGEVEEWGKRKLAYEINDLTEGDYTLINFHADPASIAELDRVLRITDAVERHMIVRRDDQE